MRPHFSWRSHRRRLLIDLWWPLDLLTSWGCRPHLQLLRCYGLFCSLVLAIRDHSTSVIWVFRCPICYLSCWGGLKDCRWRAHGLCRRTELRMLWSTGWFHATEWGSSIFRFHWCLSTKQYTARQRWNHFYGQSQQTNIVSMCWTV